MSLGWVPYVNKSGELNIKPKQEQVAMQEGYYIVTEPDLTLKKSEDPQSEILTILPSGQCLIVVQLKKKKHPHPSRGF